MDFTYLNSISDGDEEFIEQFISTFKSNTEKLINAMEQSLAAKDYQSLSKQAHQLKPSLEMLQLDTYETCLGVQDNPEEATTDKINRIKSSCGKALETLRKEYG